MTSWLSYRWRPVQPPKPDTHIDLGLQRFAQHDFLLPSLHQVVTYFAVSQSSYPKYPGRVSRLMGTSPARHIGSSELDGAKVPLDAKTRWEVGQRLLTQLNAATLDAAASNLSSFCGAMVYSLKQRSVLQVAQDMRDVARGKGRWPARMAHAEPDPVELLGTADILTMFPDRGLWMRNFPPREPQVVDLVVFRLAEMCHRQEVNVPWPRQPTPPSASVELSL